MNDGHGRFPLDAPAGQDHPAQPAPPAGQAGHLPQPGHGGGSWEQRRQLAPFAFGTGRFGAATPGARPDRADLESLVSQPAPSRPRTWRRLVIPAVVLAVAGGGYAAGHFVTSAGTPDLVTLVVTSTALPQGAKLSGADLHLVTVAASAAPRGALGPSAAAGLIGLVTDRPVPAGTFLSRSLVAPGGAIPGPGQAQVGLALKPGQVPSGGLADGQRVLVVLLPQDAQGTPRRPVPLGTATVWGVAGPGSTGIVAVTVVVPAYLAASLAGYASRGQVALIATYAASASPGPSASPSPSPSRSPRGTHRKPK